MASALSNVQVSREKLLCAICLEVFKNPATIPCGHNFCLDCISRFWDQQFSVGAYSCPQCRESFISRPRLHRNIIVCDIVEDFLKSGAKPGISRPLAGPGDVACDFCSGGQLRAARSCLACLASYCEEHLTPHRDSPAFQDHPLTQPVRNIQERKCKMHRKHLELFCRSDKTFICCVGTTGEHREHEVVTLEEEAHSRKGRVIDSKAAFDRVWFQEARAKLESMGIKGEFSTSWCHTEHKGIWLLEANQSQDNMLEFLRAATEKELYQTDLEMEKHLQATLLEIGTVQDNIDSITRTTQQVELDITNKFSAMIDAINEALKVVIGLIGREQQAALNQANSIRSQLEQKCTELKEKKLQLEILANKTDHFKFVQESLCFSSSSQVSDVPKLKSDLHSKLARASEAATELSVQVKECLRRAMKRKLKSTESRGNEKAARLSDMSPHTPLLPQEPKIPNEVSQYGTTLPPRNISQVSSSRRHCRSPLHLRKEQQAPKAYDAIKLAFDAN